MAPQNIRLVADVEQLNAASLWLLTLASVLTWSILAARWENGRRLLAARRPAEAPWGLMDVWIIILLWFGGMYVLTASRRFWIVDAPLFNFLASAMTLFVTIAGAGWLYVRFGERVLQRLVPRNMVRDSGLGMIAFVAIVPLTLWLMTILVEFFPYHHETLDLITQRPSAWVIAISFVSAGLFAPIAEEFFFRGVLQSWLQRLRAFDVPAHRYACIYGDPPTAGSATTMQEIRTRDRSHSWPIVVTAFIFAAVHADQWPAPIALFLFGLVLGYLFQKTGSLIPCIVLHMGLNLYSLTWQTLAAVEQTQL